MLQSIQIGKIKTYIDSSGAEFKSAMIKDEILKSVVSTKFGLQGDFVADSKHHGGREKAIFANALSNYPIWEGVAKKSLKFGYMGENFTIKGHDERNVYIGDIHKIGSMTLQVSQPRKPCAKLYKILGVRNFTKFIFSSGLSGWYYRVLESGECKAGDFIEVKSVESVKMSVMELNRLYQNPKENLGLFHKLKALKTIANGWVETIEKRLDGSYDLEFMERI